MHYILKFIKNATHTETVACRNTEVMEKTERKGKKKCNRCDDIQKSHIKAIKSM